MLSLVCFVIRKGSVDLPVDFGIYRAINPLSEKPHLTDYSACMVYTKTIIHFSVGENGGYLPPLR